MDADVLFIFLIAVACYIAWVYEVYAGARKDRAISALRGEVCEIRERLWLYEPPRDALGRFAVKPVCGASLDARA